MSQAFYSTATHSVSILQAGAYACKVLCKSVSQSVLYIFSSHLGLFSDVWPHCVASNQHNNPMYSHDEQQAFITNHYGKYTPLQQLQKLV